MQNAQIWCASLLSARLPGDARSGALSRSQPVLNVMERLDCPMPNCRMAAQVELLKDRSLEAAEYFCAEFRGEPLAVGGELAQDTGQVLIQGRRVLLGTAALNDVKAVLVGLVQFFGSGRVA